MINETLKHIIYFFVLIFIQVLVLNNIRFLGFINPYLYVYFILFLPSSISKDMTLCLGFLLGLIIDIFSGTLGCNTFATVLLAYLKPIFQKAFGPREDYDIVFPSLHSFGMGRYIQYVFYLVFIHQLVFFYVETLSFAYFWRTLLSAVCCSIFTVLLIICIEEFKERR